MRNALSTATLLAAVSSPAWADEFTCRGTVGAVALDKVFVPDGATCLLQHTRLKGSIVVGSLQAFDNTGGVRLDGKRMNGHLRCKANMPAPTGSGNVSPSKEDQCARL